MAWTSSATPPESPFTIRVPPLRIGMVSGGLVVAGVPLVRWVFGLTWGRPDRLGVGFLVSVLAGILAHELIHALAYLASGARPSSIRFGGSLRRGALCVGSDAALRVRAYRCVALAPGVILGLPPLVIGLTTGLYATAQFGVLMIAAAGGDLCLTWALRAVPRDARIGDDLQDPLSMRVEPPSET